MHALAETASQNFEFVSRALEPGELQLVSMTGREALGELFRYELVLRHRDDLVFDDERLRELMVEVAGVTFPGEEQDRALWGVLRELEIVPRDDGRGAEYRAVLVPRLWYATQTRRSRVFQGMSVPDIVRAVLHDTGMDESHFVFDLAETYAAREYVLQYQETDLDFVCRLLEHEGITFHFIHSDESGDQVVLTDANDRFDPHDEDGAKLAFSPGGTGVDDGESVWDVVRMLHVVPDHVHVRDYHHRTPRLAVLGSAKVGVPGVGHQVLYGEHVRTPAQAKHIARIRAEEIASGRDVVTGKSRLWTLGAGQTFELEFHPVKDLCRKYVVTEVRHRVDQSPERQLGGPATTYENVWTAVPADVPFRPARRTRRPRVEGILTGIVDGLANGMAAPLDSEGRYRVLLPLDVGGKAGGLASPWIRTLQAASGAAFGVQFPLHVGVEVAIAHVNGDPDRPVILGAVPNPETFAPVTSDNATRAIVQTRAGVLLEFEDDA